MNLDFTSEQLLRYVTPDETAAEFLRRALVEVIRTGLVVVDQYVSFRPGHVLEIAGPSRSGKSELLIQVWVCVQLKQGGQQAACLQATEL